MAAKLIGLMGTPIGSGNRGVSALGSSLVNLCSQAAPDSRVVLLLGNQDDKPARFRIGGQLQFVPVVHARLTPWSVPRHHLLWILLMAMLYRIFPFARRVIARSTPWIRTVAAADQVGDIRGGDSFSDIYGMQRFLYGFVLAWTVILIKGTLVQFPQTYGPYKSLFARKLARFLLRRSSVIVARDRQSQRIAQELAGAERKVLLSPDVAFSLEAIHPERIELDPPLPSDAVPHGVIGLNVNGLMYNGGYTGRNMFGLKLDYAALLPLLVTNVLRKHSGEIWLVPHTFASDEDVESDPAASRRVIESLPQELRARVRIVAREYDQHEIKGVIGTCDFFIGSRMHACIAALSQGIPCVGVAYSMKFAGVFDTVGMQDWVVDARETSNEQALARIMELYGQRANVSARLKPRAAAARIQLQEVFHQLIAD